MSYRTIFQILLMLAIISTLCICIMKPQMHKSVLVYNSDYIITPSQEVETETQQVPVMEMKTGPQNKENKVEEIYDIQTYSSPQTEVSVVRLENSQPSVVKEVMPVKKQQTNVSTQKTDVVSPKTTAQKVVTTTPSINLQKILDNNKTIQNAPKTEVQSAPAPVRTAVVPKTGSATVTKTAPAPAVIPQATTKTTQSAPQPKVLTAAEEEIAWNIWRSNLQNQLMRDVKLPSIPQGTRFDYSFTVDKYGKVTDVKTYATPSSYTPYAIQYIAPVIRNYQGRSILRFPEGSQRVTTVAKGAWKISASSKYSTPQDYNDVEKVTK